MQHDTRRRAQNTTGDPVRHSVAGGGRARSQGSGGWAGQGSARQGRACQGGSRVGVIGMRVALLLQGAGLGGQRQRSRGQHATEGPGQRGRRAPRRQRHLWYARLLAFLGAQRAHRRPGVPAGSDLRPCRSSADCCGQNVWRHGAAGCSPLEPARQRRFSSLIDLSQWTSQTATRRRRRHNWSLQHTCVAPNGSVHRRARNPTKRQECGAGPPTCNRLQPPKPWRHPSRSPWAGPGPAPCFE